MTSVISFFVKELNTDMLTTSKFLFDKAKEKFMHYIATFLSEKMNIAAVMFKFFCSTV